MPAGCNLQDELFASFEQIMALADKRGEPYARCASASSSGVVATWQQQSRGVAIAPLTTCGNCAVACP
jgi:hypothetical protein